MRDDEENPALIADREDADLENLRQEHRQLDAQIEALQLQGASDLNLMSLKRRKLQIKDRIAWMLARSRPDIIA